MPIILVINIQRRFHSFSFFLNLFKIREYLLLVVMYCNDNFLNQKVFVSITKYFLYSGEKGYFKLIRLHHINRAAM